MSTGPVPHVGGPIVLGDPKVRIGGQPAARMGDLAICTGPPPAPPLDVIAMGCPTVLFGGQPAARMGHPIAHGGEIVEGYPKVMIG